MTPARIRRCAGRTFLLAGIALMAGSNVCAAPIVIDDRASVVDQPVLSMQWRNPVPGRRADTILQGVTRVHARLDLHAWVGQSVHVYMALDPTPGQPVHASWRTTGRLLAGALDAGDRVLVYDGRVVAPLLEDLLELTLTTDGRTLATPAGLHFHFELETR